MAGWRWVPVLLVAVAAAIHTLPAADCPERIGHWPYGPTEGVALYNDYLVYGAGSVLTVADVSTQTAPTVVGEIRLEGFVRGIDVSGATAFAATSERGLVAVDLSDPADPTVEDHILGDMNLAVNVTIAGSTAWVAGGSGVVAIDISDPSDLQQVGSLIQELSGGWDIAVSGDLAVVVTGAADDFYTVDISDRTSPQSLGMLELDYPYGVDISGDYAYVADKREGVHVVDISDPSSPELVTTITEGWDDCYNARVADGLLLVPQRLYGLSVFDLSDPETPVHLGRFTTDGQARDVVYRDGTAFVADQYRGVAIADLSTPSDPDELAVLEGIAQTRELAVSEGLAAATAVGDVHLLDISDPTTPTRITTYRPYGWADDVDLADGHAYLAISDSRLGVVDVTDPYHPQQVGTLEIEAVDRVYVDDGLAVVVGSDLLTTVDVTNPSSPSEIGRLELDFQPDGLLIVGDVAYLSEYGEGLYVIDLATPSAPQEVGLVPMGNVSQPLEAANDLLFVGDGNDGLRIFDIGRPLSPSEIAIHYETTWISGIAAVGNLLGVSTIYDDFHVVDVTDPANPVELAVHPMVDDCEADAEAIGNLVVVTEKESGVEIFNLAGCITDPPTADFTVAPTTPEAGESVQLTDTSAGTVSAWEWSFGDTGASTEQHPTHTWDEAGSYEVTLTASGPGGTDSITRVVTVSGGTSGSPPITEPGEMAYIISAAAHIGGAAGTNWVTDVVLHNPQAQDATTHLYFMERGRNNTGAAGWEILVSAGASVELADIVLELFDETDAAGAILIGSDRELKVTSRTYNDVTEGTYGQFIPGQPMDEASDEARLIQLTRNDDYRTNIGFANPNPTQLDVGVQLLAADGTSFGEWFWVTVPPYGSVQETDIFGADVEDGMAQLWSGGDLSFFAYASVVDNTTGDPILILDAPLSSLLWLPAAAHVGGYVGTDWRTDLEVYNDGDTDTTCTVELLETDTANETPAAATVTVPPGAAVRTEDVLDELFDYTGTGALRLTLDPHPGIVSSRTYNRTQAGTFGQCIPAASAGSVIPHGESGRLVQLHQSGNDQTGFRTNIGLVSSTDTTIDVDIELHDGGGCPLGQPIDVRLDPWEHRQLNKVFRDITGSPVRNGYAVLSTTTAGGSFMGYASVVDNRSGDPVYMPAD